jgi:hypothetical protein
MHLGQVKIKAAVVLQKMSKARILLCDVTGTIRGKKIPRGQ